MKCKKCGTEFSEGVFCPMCGTKNEEVIIDQEKVIEIEKKERKKAEEAAAAEAKKKIEEEKEIIRNNAEKNAREEAIKEAQEKARQNISSDDEDIRNEAHKRVREEAIQNAKLEEERKKREEENRKEKEEKKINRKAIISLILGIASWVGMLTIILPIVGGIWAIVDGCKALKGKTKYKKSAIIGIVLPILLYVLLIIVTVQDVVSGSKREAELNSYIENGQYAEAQEFIAQEYNVGTLSYVEKSAQLYELQEKYDEAVDLWVEYCSNEYKPIDIPDSRINKLNEYLDKFETDLKPETVEKVHSLIDSKDLAKAKEQAVQETEEKEKQSVKEPEEQIVKTEIENFESEKEIVSVENEYMQDEFEENDFYESASFSEDSFDESDWSNTKLIETVSYEENGFSSIIDFPYQNSKQANKLLKFYKKVLEADASEFVTVECESKSITNSSMQYKQTTSSSSFKYYGEIKNGLPHGQGCVVGYIGNYGVYMPIVLGNFKNGQLDGYAINFSQGGMFSILSEGNYKKGIEDGDYVRYTGALNNIEDLAYGETDLIFLYGEGSDSELLDQYKDFINKKKNNINSGEAIVLTDIPLTPVYISTTGEYKDGKTVGKWIIYYYNGTVRSEIKMDSNGKTGKGTIYYPDGTMQYTGEINEGKYHGKGTLYKKDGSVEYKGKFKNGNIVAPLSA